MASRTEEKVLRLLRRACTAEALAWETTEATQRLFLQDLADRCISKAEYLQSGCAGSMVTA